MTRAEAGAVTGEARLLWLLRHAKAVPDPPSGGTDHDRPLAPRGRRDADALGRRLGPGGDVFGLSAAGLPTLVLCSTAARTTETAERVLAPWPPARRPALDRRRALYGASPEQVLEVLATVADDVASVMVVGHNPTAHALASMLPSGGADQDFPTCGLAVLGFEIQRWEDVAEGTASELGRFAPPY